MNDTLGIIREFRTKNFVVRVTADNDWDVDLSFDETGEVREKLESGELVCFSAVAKVYCRGSEVSADYLCGCIYESIEEFQDHIACGKQNKELRAKARKQHKRPAICGSYFSDMIRTVIAEARTEIATLKTVHVRTQKVKA